jgi:hypothetical protein
MEDGILHVINSAPFLDHGLCTCNVKLYMYMYIWIHTLLRVHLFHAVVLVANVTSDSG